MSITNIIVNFERQKVQIFYKDETIETYCGTIQCMGCENAALSAPKCNYCGKITEVVNMGLVNPLTGGWIEEPPAEQAPEPEPEPAPKPEPEPEPEPQPEPVENPEPEN